MWASVSFFTAIVFATLALASPAFESRAVGFAADPYINAEGIFNAAKKAKQVLATFPSGHGTNVKIFGDWQNLHGGVSAIPFIADMDVDCDGVFVSPGNLPVLKNMQLTHLLAYQFRCPVSALPTSLTRAVIQFPIVPSAQPRWSTTDLIRAPRREQSPLLRHPRIVLRVP